MDTTKQSLLWLPRLLALACHTESATKSSHQEAGKIRGGSSKDGSLPAALAHPAFILLFYELKLKTNPCLFLFDKFC